MKPEKEKELYSYLQKELQLPDTFQREMDGLDLPVKLDNSLQGMKDRLRDALQSPYPTVIDLKGVLETLSVIKVSDLSGDSDTKKLEYLIDEMMKRGYILPFIAEAYQHYPKNAKLNQFVRGDLKELLLKLLPKTPPPPQTTSQANDRSSPVSSGSNGHAPDPIHRNGNRPLPEPVHLPVLVPTSQLIDGANQLIDDVKKAIESIDTTLQHSGHISDEVTRRLDAAIGKIEQLSSSVQAIPAPHHPALHFRLSGEQYYFCEQARLIRLTVQKINTQADPQPSYQIEKRLEKLLQSLEQAKNLMTRFVELPQQYRSADNTLSETGA